MSTETVNPELNGEESSEKLHSPVIVKSELNGDDSSEHLQLPETLKTELNGEDSSEQLHSSAIVKPELNGDESSELVKLTEALAEPTEKRKREGSETVTETEQKQQNPLWKTTLCSYFRRNDGSCSHGESCRYAHGESELRVRPDNTWDPTSDRAKKMAKTAADDDGEKAEDKEEKCNDVMMTEALDDDECSSVSGLSKCLVNLPMKWSSDNLRCFLKEHVSCLLKDEFFLDIKHVRPIHLVFIF